MKKLIALCMAMLMSLALLAGCSSADPENPYAQEPAPSINSSADDEAETEEEEDTSAVISLQQA